MRQISVLRGALQGACRPPIATVVALRFPAPLAAKHLYHPPFGRLIAAVRPGGSRLTCVTRPDARPTKGRR